MTTIRKATPQDAAALATLSVASFLPAHGHSAPKKEIDSYVTSHFTVARFEEELSHPNYTYYLFFSSGTLAGYSKVIFNTPHPNVTEPAITKMERLYMLEAYYGKGFGQQLFDFNIQLAKKAGQKGIWLAVWTENHRAIAFYTKMGFTRVGSYDFKISAKHSNPNHIMYLAF